MEGIRGGIILSVKGYNSGKFGFVGYRYPLLLLRLGILRALQDLKQLLQSLNLEVSSPGKKLAKKLTILSSIILRVFSNHTRSHTPHSCPNSLSTKKFWNRLVASCQRREYEDSLGISELLCRILIGKLEVSSNPRCEVTCPLESETTSEPLPKRSRDRSAEDPDCPSDTTWLSLDT